MIDMNPQYPVSGAGLGFRRPLADKLKDVEPGAIDFMEIAPENWIHVGGALGKKLRWFTERYPFLVHGLSLSIGAPSPLNEQLVRDIKVFMAEHNIRMYSEHLSSCGDDGQLYDLMPIPFTEDANTSQAASAAYRTFSNSVLLLKTSPTMRRLTPR